MKTRLLVNAASLNLFLAATMVMAQQPGKQGKQPAAPKTYSSAADVTAMVAKARTDAKEDQPLFLQNLLRLAPYTANLEYRRAGAPAALHEKEAEVMYVIDGSGTIMTGGKLVGETRTNAANLSGTAIEGGDSRDVAKVDFLIVPENTPHWFSKINGTMVLMTLHVPRPVPTP